MPTEDLRVGICCDICGMKITGSDDCIIEHYAITHCQLIDGIMDTEESGVDLELSKEVLLQLFPQHVGKFEESHNE